MRRISRGDNGRRGECGVNGFFLSAKNSKIFGITLSAAIYFFLAAETSEFSRIFV